MNKFCTCLISITQMSHPHQLVPYNFPEQRSQNVQKVIPFGKVRPKHTKVEPHFGKLLAHLGKVSPHLGKLLAHLGKVEPHLGKLLAHLGKVSPHLGKLSAPFGGLPAENEPLRLSALALRGLPTAVQARSDLLKGCCGGLQTRFSHPSSPRQEVALIS